jgi:hypothetical protein
MRLRFEGAVVEIAFEEDHGRALTAGEGISAKLVVVVGGVENRLRNEPAVRIDPDLEPSGVEALDPLAGVTPAGHWLTTLWIEPELKAIPISTRR